MRDICENLRELITEIDEELIPMKARVKHLDSWRRHINKLLGVTKPWRAKRGELEPGSVCYRARAIIREAGRPLHVKEISQHMGVSDDRSIVNSITTQLSKHAKGGSVFKRTAPNTFGLLDEDGDNSGEH